MPEKKNIKVVCNLLDEMPSGKIEIKLPDEYTFTYKNYEVKITSTYYIHTTKTSGKEPYIYSNEQIIDIKDDIDEYEIKFRLGSYNNEILCFYRRYSGVLFNLDCKPSINDLICKFSREKIMGSIPVNVNDPEFSIMIYDDKTGLDYLSDSIMGIKFNYQTTKETIYVNITKLLDNVAESYSMIPYETNITNISTLSSNGFYLNFFSPDKSSYASLLCSLRKNDDDKPLMFLCYPEYSSIVGTFILGEFSYPYVIDENAKYTFIFNEVKNDEPFTLKNNGGYILSKYPETLDFTSNDKITVWIAVNTVYIKGLTLNPKWKDLNCKFYDIYICEISKSYFEEKKSGYYYLYHTNHMGGKSPNYEISPFKVIFSEDRGKGAANSQKLYSMLFFLFILFLI